MKIDQSKERLNPEYARLDVVKAAVLTLTTAFEMSGYSQSVESGDQKVTDFSQAEMGNYDPQNQSAAKDYIERLAQQAMGEDEIYENQ